MKKIVDLKSGDMVGVRDVDNYYLSKYLGLFFDEDESCYKLEFELARTLEVWNLDYLNDSTFSDEYYTVYADLDDFKNELCYSRANINKILKEINCHENNK